MIHLECRMTSVIKCNFEMSLVFPVPQLFFAEYIMASGFKLFQEFLKFRDCFLMKSVFFLKCPSFRYFDMFFQGRVAYVKLIF